MVVQIVAVGQDNDGRILHGGIEDEPSGVEGLQDVRIIRALYRSAEDRKPIKLDHTPPRKRPSTIQEISRPPVRKAELVAAEGPSPH